MTPTGSNALSVIGVYAPFMYPAADMKRLSLNLKKSIKTNPLSSNAFKDLSSACWLRKGWPVCPPILLVKRDWARSRIS
jgi:hypothetical protein